MSAVTGISGIQLSAASAAYAPTNSAEVSAIASAYATGKQDALTFGYDDDSAISSINGSALAGGGGATGDYVEKSAVPLEIGSSISATNTSVAIGSFATAKDLSVAIGRIVSATGTSVALGGRASASNGSFSFGWYSTAKNDSVTMGYYAGATNNSIALGYGSQANASAVAIGRYLNAGSKNNVFGDYNSTANSANTVFSIGDGTANTARHNLLEIAKDGEITMYSSTADTVGTGIMSSIRALSANAGGVDSATVSAIASSYAESAVSSKLDESATADFYTTVNPSGFIDSAYVASAVSGKADESALSSYYTTANESGFIGSAYVDSALSSYALSADVSGTVDLVSTQSANWGGSALALSAGPGVSLTKSGTVLVAGLDETLLWSGSLAAVDNVTLTASSSPTDYRSIKFVFEGYADNQRAPQELYFSGCDKEFDIMPIGFIGTGIRLSHVRLKFAGTVGTFSETVQYNITTTIATSVDRPYLRAIYGINRTAEA